MSDSEQLREALLDLERARAKERELRLEAESLFDGLRVLSLSGDKAEVFHELLEVLRAPLGFNDAFILTLSPEDGLMRPSVWTSSRYAETLWRPGVSFGRALRGKPVAVFDVRRVPEWREQSDALLAEVSSALHIPLTTERQQALLICTHAEIGFFARRHVKLSRRLSLLASQALLQLELREEIRQREQRLSTIIENSPVILWSFDRLGRLLHAQGQGLRMLGLSEQTLLQLNLEELDDLLPGLLDDIHTVLSGREVSSTFECTGRMFETFFAPLRSHDDGEICGVIGISTDITDRVQMERVVRLNEQLKRARDSAIQANRAKSAFLANISHELRTPLNAIIGYSEMLEEDARELGLHAFCEDLGKIHSAGRMLLSLIGDLLDLSKIEAEKMEVHLESFNPKPILEEIMQTVEPTALRNHNQLSLHDELEGAEIISDPTRFRQILLNLLSNACKFTQGGHVSLEARAEGEYWRFSVQDTGIGIPAEKLESIFEPFTQAELDTGKIYGGTGLGLSICKHLSRLLGGKIEVESTPGQGSTFCLVLPLDPKAALQQAGAQVRSSSEHLSKEPSA